MFRRKRNWRKIKITLVYEDMENASVLFKAKCRNPDVSLEILKNYNKEN